MWGTILRANSGQINSDSAHTGPMKLKCTFCTHQKGFKKEALQQHQIIKHDRIILTTALTYQRTAQQLRSGPWSRVLLHILNKPISFGVARQLAVHQEGALDVSVGAYQLLKLLGSESVGQVGEAEQGVGGLQGDVDQASPDSAVMEGADGILSLVPVQQSHKGWRRGHYGDSDERKRQTKTGTDTKKEMHRHKWTGKCERQTQTYI